MRDVRMLFGAAAALGLAGMLGLAPSPRHAAAPLAADSVFDHTRHREMFPTCDGCHQLAPDAVTFPTPQDCAACHDGTAVRLVDWQRSPPRPTSLRFNHQRKLTAMREAMGIEMSCGDCHAMSDTLSRGIQRVALPLCMGCHAGTGEHVADAPCATCHKPLAETAELPEERIRAFPKPPSHDDPSWSERGGHGLLASAPAGVADPPPVAASCATCHARDFCMQCHVDAPEQPAIQALGRNPRSSAIAAGLRAPASHASESFLLTHGQTARAEPRECRTCHTQESCLTCHEVTPQKVANMFPAGSNRGRGAAVVRRPPATHTRAFREEGGHAGLAAARTATCESCHARQDCLTCHRPGAADRPTATSYHPPDFLARHPALAYSRAASCSDCHNTASFCQTCHGSAGLVTNGPLARGFHDTKPLFIGGHGQAARQNLESCVSCHVERDCLTCHSALRGRRFNPHGPGFDAERLRKRSPSLCTTCHGRDIPCAVLRWVWGAARPASRCAHAR